MSKKNVIKSYRKAPRSNPAGRSTGLMEPTSLRGSRQTSSRICNSEWVITIGLERLRRCRGPKLALGSQRKDKNELWNENEIDLVDIYGVRFGRTRFENSFEFYTNILVIGEIYGFFRMSVLRAALKLTNLPVSDAYYYNLLLKV